MTKLEAKARIFYKRLPTVWFKRWDIARQNMWLSFREMPVSVESLQWLQRSHRRLIAQQMPYYHPPPFWRPFAMLKFLLVWILCGLIDP